MRALSNYIHIMLPPNMEESKGGITLAHTSTQKWFYGLVLSIGELAFAKHQELWPSGNYLKKRPPFEEGAIVGFDQQGVLELALSSMQLRAEFDMNRHRLVRYASIHTLLDDDTIEMLELHDFTEERDSLKRGHGGRVEAVLSS